MEWSRLLMLLGIISLSSASSYLEDQKCNIDIETGTTNLPDDELMNAFFITDPNPKTGQLRFTVHPQKMLQHKMQGAFTIITTPYNVWLRDLHDARIRFKQLWVYISRLVASDVAELYGHFQSDSTTTTAPRPIINFEKIKTTMDKGCSSYDTNKKTWPFSCFDSKFFCSWSKALTLLKPILLHSTTTDVDGLTCTANTFKSLAMVNKMSQLAVDSDSRAAALKSLFASDIVSRFDEEALRLPFYQSGLVRNGMFLLVSKTGYRDDVIRRQLQTVKDKITKRCTQLGEESIGKNYYCLAQKFISKTSECDKAGKSSPCIYQQIFQNYFIYGAFTHKSENDTMEMMSVRVGKSITSLLTSLRDQKTDKLKAHVNSFKPNLDMDPKICSMDWKKAFRCEKKDFDCYLKNVYRSDCQVQMLIKVIENLLEQKGTKEWTHPIVKRVYKFTTMWFLYPPFLYSNSFTTEQKKKTIDYFQAEVERVREKFEIPEFRTIRAAVPQDSFVPSWIRRKMCDTEVVSEAHKPYCLIAKLVDAVITVIRTTEGSLGDKVRILHPDIDYTKRFEQLNLGQVSDYLNKQSSIYFDMVSDRLDEIPAYVQQNFGAISQYFSKLANFDVAKSTADMNRLNNRIAAYKNRSEAINEELFSKITMIAIAAGFSVGAEAIQRSVELGLQISRNANPLAQLFGNTEPLKTMAKVAKVAKGAVKIVALGRILAEAYPKLNEKCSVLKSKYQKNADFILKAKNLVEGMSRKDDDLDDKISLFLKAYDEEYRPAVRQSDISSIVALVTKLIADLCAAAFAGGTFSSATVQIGLGSDGKCVDIKGEVAQWGSLNMEMYAYQFQMLANIAAVARAIAAQRQAQALSIVYSFKGNLDVKFLKSYAIITHLTSSLHVWEIAMQYCNVLTYQNNGVVLPVCKTARTTPNKKAIASLMSYIAPRSCNNFADIAIPTKSPSGNTEAIDYIDMDKLFKGEKIHFQIPDFNWLRKNSMFSSTDAEKSFLVNKFQIFLPWYVKGKKKVTIEVQPDTKNKLKPTDRLTYILSNNHPYTTQYTTSSLFCVKKNLLDNPYDRCKKYSNYCMEIKGTRRETLSSSIYNKWTIQVRDPDGVAPPKSKTDFKIHANIGYCLSGTKATKRRSISPKGGELRKMVKRSTSECCSAKQYFNGRSCSDCPAGSTKHPSGYFCN